MSWLTPLLGRVLIRFIVRIEFGAIQDRRDPTTATDYARGLASESGSRHYNSGGPLVNRKCLRQRFPMCSSADMENIRNELLRSGMMSTEAI